jgi:hypothetical protein
MAQGKSDEVALGSRAWGRKSKPPITIAGAPNRVWEKRSHREFHDAVPVTHGRRAHRHLCGPGHRGSVPGSAAARPAPAPDPAATWPRSRNPTARSDSGARGRKKNPRRSGRGGGKSELPQARCWFHILLDQSSLPPMSCQSVDPGVGGVRARTTPSAPWGEPSAFVHCRRRRFATWIVFGRLVTGIAVLVSGSLPFLRRVFHHFSPPISREKFPDFIFFFARSPNRPGRSRFWRVAS